MQIIKIGLSGLILSVLLISGCQSDSGVGYVAGEGEMKGTYSTFSTREVDIPAFLAPLMISNFNAALAGHGLNPVTDKPDLEVTLRYIQDDLGEMSKADDFEGHLTPGGNQRFVARIQVEFRQAGEDQLIWSGSIQRIHDVDAGEFMHTGKASTAIFDNFQKLLADFPG